MSRQEERKALRSWQEDGDQDALDRILKSHARQAWAEARRWTDNRTHIEDLAAEGMVGLIDAAGNFDLSMDVRFGTYSTWAVRNRIMAALGRVTEIIDVPARTLVDARRRRPEGQDHSDAPIAAVESVPIDDVSDGERGAVAILRDELTPEQELAVRSESRRVRQLLDEALIGLRPAEREVILKKLEERPTSTNDDPGQRSRQREIERRAMLSLRRSLQKLGFSLKMLES